MRPSTGASPGPKYRRPPFPRRQAPPSSRSPSADQTARRLGGQTFRHRVSCCPSSAVGGTPHRGLDCAEKKPSSMPPFPTRRGNWACLWIAGIQSLERRKPKIRTTVSPKLVVVPCSVQDLSSGSAFCRRAPSSHPLIMAVCHEMGRGGRALRAALRDDDTPPQSSKYLDMIDGHHHLRYHPTKPARHLTCLADIASITTHHPTLINTTTRGCSHPVAELPLLSLRARTPG